MNHYFMTSESVAPGHPDKICDLISDRIVDRAITRDDRSRVAIETAVKNDTVYLLGEITSDCDINYEHEVNSVLNDIGYDNPTWKFNPNDINVITNISQQSPEIARGVDGLTNINAGDQGHMFGYASLDTPTMMPVAMHVSKCIIKAYDVVRKKYPDVIGPDAKTQVTVKHTDDGKSLVDGIVLSFLHSSDFIEADVRSAGQEVLKTAYHMFPELKRDFVPELVTTLFNPAGKFTLGGPKADAGLTGRKIVVDTYGGYSPVGGGAFSGKDLTKVDRTAAYAARYLARKILEGGYIDHRECTVQLAYVIGRPTPISVMIKGVDQERTNRIIKNIDIDLSVKGMIDFINARKKNFGPDFFYETAKYGAFGDERFPWEK